jgi:hypothetical protein
MNTFLTLWFSSVSLLSPATHHAYVPVSVGALALYKHTYAVFEATAGAGAYIDSLAELEIEPSKKRIFKGAEQMLVLSNGKPVLLTTEFLAKDQVQVLSYDESFATHSLIGIPGRPVDKEEFYTISKSSTDLVNYTLQKSMETGFSFKIYKGREYEAKDNGRTFTFKKIP